MPLYPKIAYERIFAWHFRSVAAVGTNVGLRGLGSQGCELRHEHQVVRLGGPEHQEG